MALHYAGCGSRDQIIFQELSGPIVLVVSVCFHPIFTRTIFMPSLLFRARHTPLAHAALLLVLALPLQGALAQTGAPAPTQRFDMAAQPLAAALDQFARQAGLQLVFAPELAAGRQAPALHGQLPLREALDSLLKNSGLHGRMQDGTLTVETAPTRESTLAEVRVTASAERSAITEGSGSYKADAVTIGKTTQSLKEIPQSVWC